MKNWIVHFCLTLFLMIVASTICYAQVHVSGYYRKDGTYVRSHVRSKPDGNPYNNYSYPGNVNPYTGKVAVGDPEIYLKNCHKNSNSVNKSFFSYRFYFSYSSTGFC